MIQKKWFRIETGTDGSILSCEEVEDKGKAKGSVVRFYEALDKVDACQQAKQWYDRMRQNNKASRSALVAERKAKHVCIVGGCGKPAKGVKCEEHAALSVEANRRARQGKSAPRNQPNPHAVKATYEHNVKKCRKNKQQTWGSYHTYQLFLIVKKFDDLGAVRFRQHVCDKIREAGGGKALDEYEASRIDTSVAAE